MYQFRITTQHVTISATTVPTYGIEMRLLINRDDTILQHIPDISTNVQRLAQLCNQLQLSPVHFRDVIDDFLCGSLEQSNNFK